MMRGYETIFDAGGGGVPDTSKSVFECPNAITPY
jgi:hypothetical protein